MGSGIPIPLLLPVLSALHSHGFRPVSGNLHEPLLILEGRDGAGIRLRCLSERNIPNIRLLWSDGNGRNLSGIPEPRDSGKGGSSVLLRPGSGNAAACRILEPRSRSDTESIVVIAEDFFPAASPWIPALALLLTLGLFLLLAAALRLRWNSRILAQERKNQREILEEIEELKMELEEEIAKFQREQQEMEEKLERIQGPLVFRRAQSHAASVTPAELRGNPGMAREGNERSVPGSEAAAVAREGFSQGKHYWEVELGSGSGWELGVLAEEIRDSLRDDSVPSVPEEKVAGLEYSQGEFRLPGGKLERNSGRCRVLGLFLDQEMGVLSFFDVEEKQLLGSLPLRISGNLFPFFRPGWDGNVLGIRPVGV
ncbi:butyrophilin subfamily 2 member A1-like [Poecile atricapillus]|uniref:butyrophilin subfamily 2 member A1-like n=1 Tax=Poecile atricapillus TaxID=48891 RepID=UPI0027393623|nr:butyrophilin subfamily 2 member A1-like [Poecile atricapillus]